MDHNRRSWSVTIVCVAALLLACFIVASGGAELLPSGRAAGLAALEQSTGSVADKIDGALASKLDALADDEFVRVIIRMEEQPFVSSAMGPESTRFILRDTAERTQESVIGYLQSEAALGNVKGFNGFWIVNVVFAEVRSDQVAELSRLPGVGLLYEDIQFTAPVDSIREAVFETNMLRWDHVAAVFAPEVWDMGYKGQGVTVAVIDTGIDASHPELAGALGGEAPFHEGYWAEFDRDGNIVPGTRPRDSGNHGTHVSGTIGGRNLTYRFAVAPEVTLAHGLVLPGGTGTFPQILGSFEWVIDEGFDIINGSLGANQIIPDMAVATDNLYAAGVVPIFSNGNIRIDSVPPGAPGNTPSAIAIGAYGPDGEEASFNRGDIIEYPGYEYDEFTRIKPDISAPGVDILSTYPGDSWAWANGTSMASPKVAGVAALLLSAYPDLTVDEVKEILFASTGGHEEKFGWTDIPTKDIHFGWGRVNALQAIELAGGPRDEYVQVAGTVTGGGEPLAGASVTFSGPTDRTFTTDTDGLYSGELEEGTYEVTAAADGFVSETRTVEIADTGDDVRVDFDLEAVAPQGPSITLFDVKPRSLVRGGPVGVTAEIGHNDDDAVLHVLLQANLGDDIVGEWEFAGESVGTFSVNVDTTDGDGKPWSPNVYQLALTVTDGDGETVSSNPINIALFPPLPRSLSFLLANNPFNPEVESQRLEYAVPATGRIYVAIYTLEGRKLRTIVDERRDPGQYVAYWDGTDDRGRTALAGMYVVRVRFTDESGETIDLTRHSVVVK